jgi:hypothetical protein
MHTRGAQTRDRDLAVFTCVWRGHIICAAAGQALTFNVQRFLMEMDSDIYDAEAAKWVNREKVCVCVSPRAREPSTTPPPVPQPLRGVVRAVCYIVGVVGAPSRTDPAGAGQQRRARLGGRGGNGGARRLRPMRTQTSRPAPHKRRCWQQQPVPQTSSVAR